MILKRNITYTLKLGVQMRWGPTNQISGWMPNLAHLATSRRRPYGPSIVRPP